MIEITGKRIEIGGVPRLVVCGEIHYFRVARDEWEQRIELLAAAGCNAVASYIPWLYHELPDGSIDLTGRTRPERDVAAFIDLCRDHGLWFVARPGPFVMAELKNEGIPYRVYRDHPEVVPVGWDARPAPTRTIDYLAPAFLDECARWYAAVMPVLRPRLLPGGGNVIAVQLDNEIGMLAWVSNSPDLTDGLVADFGTWVDEQYQRCAPYPVPRGDTAAWAGAVRSPDEAFAGPLRQDLGQFMRERFARYVGHLRRLAEDHGVVGVPFAVNIHGTEGGSGASFPIGISQLVRTYAGVPGMISGSDHYLGDMTLSTTTGMYVINAFMDAVHDDDQPLTSLEFEAGTGDYSGRNELQYDPASVDLKTRLCVAQGNRLLNYYLFAGGINPPLDEPSGDGNDRISSTGERHGTAAPVTPEGRRGPTFEATARTIAAVRANEPWLARMREEHDAVQLGFVLDAYLTEYCHPASAVMADAVADLTTHRGAGEGDALARSLLLGGYRFGAVNLQETPPALESVLVLGSGRYLAEYLQVGLLEHVRSGGCLLMLGPLPVRDLDGNRCTALVDALGVTPGELVRDSPGCFPSVVGRAWAAERTESRVGWRQEFAARTGDVILTDLAGAVCGAEIPLGAGSIVLLCAGIGCDVTLFGAAVRRLGADPGVRLDAAVPGVFVTTSATDDGQRLVHLLNVSGYTASVRLGLDGLALNGGDALTVPPRSGHMLPHGLCVEGVRIRWANAELRGAGDGRLLLRPGLGFDGDAHGTVVVFDGDPGLAADGDTFTIEPVPGGVRVRTLPGRAPASGLELRLLP